MDQKDLILKIKLLKKVQPRKEWKDSNRAFLLAKIDREFNKMAQTAPETVKVREKRASSLIRDIQMPVHNFKTEEISDFETVETQNFASLRDRLAMIFSSKVLFRPAFAMVLFFSISCGALAMGIKSQDTIPGNFLYPVKIVIENTETYFTVQDKKSEMHTNLATRRLDEAVKISKADETNSAKKDKIEKSIDTFKKEIKIAEAHMNEPAIKDEPEKAVEMAKNIETKTKEFEKVLKDIPEDLPDEIKKDVENTVKKALVVAEEASDSALGVMIENMNGSISGEEILAKITEKIEIEKEKIAVAEVKVEEIKKINDKENQEKETEDKAESVGTQDFVSNSNLVSNNFVSEIFAFWEIKAVLAEEEEILDDNNDSDIISDEESIDRVIKDLGEIRALLEKAEEYLKEDDFETAWEYVSIVIKLMKKTEIAIEELPAEEEISSDESEQQSDEEQSGSTQEYGANDDSDDNDINNNNNDDTADDDAVDGGTDYTTADNNNSETKNLE